jgi:hypothetical protein
MEATIELSVEKHWMAPGEPSTLAGTYEWQMDAHVTPAVGSVRSLTRHGRSTSRPEAKAAAMRAVEEAMDAA